MKKHLMFILFCGIAISALGQVSGQNNFDGRWKVNVKQIKTTGTNPMNEWINLAGNLPNEIKINQPGVSILPIGELDTLSAADVFSQVQFGKQLLKFTYSELGNNEVTGDAKLKYDGKDSFKGKLSFDIAGGVVTVLLELDRIWCCGNHNPKHCEDAITKDCKEISSQ